MKTKALTHLVLTVSLIVCSGSLFSQKTIKVKDFSNQLPKIQLEEKTPQKYLLTIDNQNFDIYGNPGSKSRITAEYTRGLPNNAVRWNNVRIDQAQKPNKPFTEGAKQHDMEDYSYVVSEEMAKGTFFKVNSDADLQMKTLAWDMFTLEIIAWDSWDSLKLNTEYQAKKINTELNVEGLGSIENKDMRITWTGVTKENGKLCAIIQFNSMNNPLNFNASSTKIKGRSHFWGNIYVALSDKQIEYGELHEDVLMDIRMNGQEPGMKAYSTRRLALEKIH